MGVKRLENHLGAYLDELEWRFNHRKNPCLFGVRSIRLRDAELLPYRNLTSF